MLAGCHHNNGRIAITDTASDLTLATAGTIGGERPCANVISVTPLTSEDADPVWQVIGVSPATCARPMRYGASSPDFMVRFPAQPLRAGIRYQVRMSGAGFSLVRNFHLTATGVRDDG